MGRSPCCDKNGLKKGPWTPEEDQKLIDYIQKHGCGNWRTLPKNAGLQRCGKSCRLRWTNYLRPDIKRGRFSFEEEETIIQLHGVLGNKWSAIAARLPGRTDNEIKNYWNTHIRKRLLRMGIDPVTHSPRLDLLDLSSIFNSSLYNQSHTNLSRLLGVVDPQLLKLATSLISDQNQTQIPQFEAAYSTNLNTTCEVPFSDRAQLMSSSLDHFGTSTTSEWPNIGNIDYVPSLPSYYNNFCYGSDQADPSFSEPSNLYSANSNRKNNTSFSFNVNTPSCSPPPLTSSSTYTNNGAAGSCSTVTDQDERGSYCSSLLKFEVPDLLDVSELL